MRIGERAGRAPALVACVGLCASIAPAGRSATPTIEHDTLVAPGGRAATAPAAAAVVQGYGRLPLAFEENRGQTDPQVRYLSRGSGHTLFLTASEIVLRLRGGPVPAEETRPDEPESAQQLADAVVRLSLVGAQTSAEIVGTDELPGRSHYFVGSDPSAWRRGVPSYARVRYREVYPGIEVEYYGNQGQLEYDFVVKPGADPGLIRLHFEGADEMRLDEAGNLVLVTAAGELIQKRPVIFQDVDGRRQEVDGRYVRHADEAVGLEIRSYDAEAPLVVDPVLIYSTYLGGGSIDQAAAVAVDGAGSAYVTGRTASTDFPTRNAVQGDQATWDVFVTKLSPGGDSLTYSTYLGGNDADIGNGIAVDGAGSAYIVGLTDSTDFPTASPYQTDQGARDLFVAKLSPDGGSLLYSTYLGGSAYDSSGGIAVDGAGSVYVTGDTSSTDFPTENPYQTYQASNDAFVTKLSADGSSVEYSTYLGGSDVDSGAKIAVDGSGSAYVVGHTFSTDFPTAGPYQTDQGGCDVFVTKLHPNGGSLVYSTYLGGGGYEYARGVAVDGAGSVFVTGSTESSNFPTQDPYQTDQPGEDAFVTKVSPAGNSLEYSTYLGGSGDESAPRIALDAVGSAFVAGSTDSADFPLANPYQTDQPGQDAFVVKLSPTGSALEYSTYLGGAASDNATDIAVDGQGRAYLVGYTLSTDFPTRNPYQGGQGSTDAFVTQLAAILHLDVDLASVLNGSGQVEAEPAGGTCANAPGAPEHCQYWYQEGTDVTLTATPASGSLFAAWGGACSGANPCTVTMDADLTVTADFRGPCLTPPGFGGATSATEGVAGTCSVDLGWTAAVPACDTDVTYSVYRSSSSGFTPDASTRIASGVTGTGYTDSVGLAGSGTYHYVVRATDVSNMQEETNTSEASVVLSSCVSTAPEGVRFFNVSSGNGQNVLDWVNPVAGFGYTEIRYSTSDYPSTPTAGSLAVSSSGGAGAVENAVHTVPNGATYYYTAFVNGPTGWETAGKVSFGRPADDSGAAKWGYRTDASSLETAGVLPSVSYHGVSNDRVVHAMSPGALGGMWPAGWRPLAMNDPSQGRPTVVRLSSTTVMGASRVGLVGSQDGRVYAFDAESGALLWASAVLGVRVQAAPSAIFRDYGGAYDLVLVGTRNSTACNVFYGLHLMDGTEAWRFDNGGCDTPPDPEAMGLISEQARVDYATSRVYFTSHQHATGSPDTVWALSFTDTSAVKLWSKDLSENVEASPTLAGGVLYVGTVGGAVHALDPESSGADLWAAPYSTGDGGVKSLVWPDLANGVGYASSDGRVHAIDLSDGSAFWPSVSVSNVSAPLLSGGRLYVGGANSRLHELDALTGAETAGSPVVLGDELVPKIVGRGTLDVSTGIMIVGTDDGVIYGVAIPFPTP